MSKDASDYNIADILRNVNNPAADHSNIQGTIVAYNITAMCIVVITVAVRTLVRSLIVRHVATEDYLMLGAGMAAVSLSAMVIVGVGYGLGKNIWDLNLLTILDAVKDCIQTLFICQCLHALALTLVKLSIISTYWRIFPTKPVRWTLLGLAGSIIAVSISAIFGVIFQCRPIAGAWDFNLDRTCFPVEDLLYFSTAFSAFTDIVLCLLPLPFFWKLDVSRKEKILVSCLFGLGLFAAAASIIRITTLNKLQNINATMASMPTLGWSIAEVITGVVCACLPCLKPLMKRLMPGKFFTRRTATHKTAKSISPPRPQRPPSQMLASLSSSGSGHWRGRGDSWYGKSTANVSSSWRDYPVPRV